ncbi:uncharacterized protein SPPG_02853 [Spizellomyces punctatus DAOM BR117]|uniref:C2H2-type domain-containing protein n=1 Tax=Spizellomyces punctatus (strain DAOM BR117) TaxID=645134 RepID=A0A0L0HNI6_SPIPD|nr:uncharacterized protein SPPG_02853 [Spizellomyces punctatus DAOM BR117]KND02384.1 hypothetical protein SPPG_02853 [Spizellomyces punctatus DAOM BR117]|eukprot:XP_016610423.1 hypothetical protein SPPG_02853 [Spizellomyces punctatus DAOM BR117]
MAVEVPRHDALYLQRDRPEWKHPIPENMEVEGEPVDDALPQEGRRTQFSERIMSPDNPKLTETTISDSDVSVENESLSNSKRKQPWCPDGSSKRLCTDRSSISSSPIKHLCPFEGCNRVFTKSSKLTRHQVSHTNERTFVCPHPGCDKTYLRADHLARHALTHAPTPEFQKPFKCDHPDCGRAFASRYHLNRHIKLHETPRPYKCSFGNCTDSFAKHSQLRRHMCTHTGQKAFPCPACDKSFSTSQKLKQHLRLHSTNPRYQCTICNTTCPKWSLLQAHMKEAHKPVCDICHKTFSRRDVLKNHMKIHAVDRELWACEWDGCGKVFTSAKIRAIHVRSTHEKVKAFLCNHDGCGAEFAHKHLLVRHRRLHETSPTVRKKRSDAIPPPTLLEHLTGHNYAGVETGRSKPCPIVGCRFAFRRQYDLDRHIRSVHRRIDEADVIDKVVMMDGDSAAKCTDDKLLWSMGSEKGEREPTRRKSMRTAEKMEGFYDEAELWSDSDEEFRPEISDSEVGDEDDD